MTSTLTKITGKFTRLFLHYSNLSGYLEPIMQSFIPAWRDGYYRAQLIAKTRLNQDFIALELKPEARWPIHQAGQHVSLTVEINGRLMTRVFSIASSPTQALHEGVIRLVIKQSELGALTPHLNNLAIKQWVNLSSPKGTFTLPTSNTPILMIAGGAGITPFLAMLHQCVNHQIAPITLLYYAKPGEHILTTELICLAQVSPRLTVKLMTRNEHGCVTQYITDVANQHVMICGPSALYDTVKRHCEQHHLHLCSEHFSITPLIKDEKTQLTTHQVLHNGKTLSFHNQASFLSQFTQQSIAVNSGCGMGICHQCQCTKKRGIVRDLRTGHLSDSGEELIQLCVTVPVSEVELVS